MMKKLFLYTIMTCIVLGSLSACSEEKDYSDTYNPETDYQFYLREQGLGIRAGESDTGYYFLNAHYIYYMDKATMKPVLLDNRPDSDLFSTKGKEQAENSNAYVGVSGPGFLSFYDGKLYTIETEYVMEKDKIVDRNQLVEISKDGAKRNKLLTFDFYPLAIAVHRGVIYYSSMGYSTDLVGKYQVLAYDLKKRSKPKVIYDGEFQQGTIANIIPYGKNVYIHEAYANNNTGINAYRTLRYDIKDGTISQMFSDDEANVNYGGIMDNQLIFTKFYGDVQDKRSWIGYKSDLQGNNPEALPIANDFFSDFYASGSYIYTRPVWEYLGEDMEGREEALPHRMAVYDNQYKKIAEIDLSLLPASSQFLVGDDRYMFVRYEQDDKSIIAYLDKQEIAAGKASFKTIIETPLRMQ